MGVTSTTKLAARKRARELGNCVACLHRPVVGEDLCCPECQRKARERHRNKVRLALAEGRCTYCYKHPAVNGRRCEGCTRRAMQLQNARRRR